MPGGTSPVQRRNAQKTDLDATDFIRRKELVWRSYTPTITSATGTLTTASGTGKYMRIGKTVWVTLDIAITTNGTGGQSIDASLPYTAAVQRLVGQSGREYLAGGKMLQGFLTAAKNVVSIRNYDNTYPAGDGYSLSFALWYEIE